MIHDLRIFMSYGQVWGQPTAKGSCQKPKVEAKTQKPSVKGWK